MFRWQYLTFVEPLIGVGEVAISDHRSSQPTASELAKLAADAHVAGLLTGKAGLLHLHLGDGRRGDRSASVRELLRLLSGAQSALVVNNNAAAVLLIASTFAHGREVLVSRGELVEIGGSFRVPEILERALDLALEQKDPQRRLERRKKREARAAGDSSPDEASAPKERTEASAVGGAQEKRSRHVPVAFKDRALERARYQCEYRGPDGARCTQRVGLEIDHRRPFGKRGVHDNKWRGNRSWLSSCSGRQRSGRSSSESFHRDLRRSGISFVP